MGAGIMIRRQEQRSERFRNVARLLQSEFSNMRNIIGYIFLAYSSPISHIEN